MNAQFSKFIGFALLILFVLALLGALKTGEIIGLGIAEYFAFLGMASLCYAKKLEDGFIFCAPKS